MDKKINLYAIRDIKVGYNVPFTLANDEVAHRTFRALCDDSNTDVGKFSKDMELWKVGTFDLDKGTITAIDPEYMVGGRDYV